MNILVIIKPIPYVADEENYQDTNFLNDSDINVIAEALDLRDSCGGKVTVMAVGAPEGEAVLKEAYTYGVDSAVLVTDTVWRDLDIRNAGQLAAAAAVHSGPYDLVLFGRQAIDGDAAHMSAMTAGYLQLPLIAYANGFTIENNHINACCTGDRMNVKLQAKLPAVVMSLSEKKRGRYPAVSDIMKAYNGTYRVRIITSRELTITGLEKTVRLYRTYEPVISRRRQMIFNEMDETEMAEKLDEILFSLGYLQKMEGAGE